MSTATAVFQPVGEVVADSRTRVSFGRAAMHPADRFLVSRNAATGEILLTPATLVPSDELAVLRDPKTLAGLLEGLKDIAEGNTVSWDEVFGDDVTE